MKIALLRIAADSGNLGFHSPIFKDNTFEYIPINENFNDNCNNYDKKIDESRTYSNTKIKTNKFLIEYFPNNKTKKYKDAVIHYDPEFESFTYGDPSANKKGLSELSFGDYLIFYSSLTRDGGTKLYVIGYFEIEEVQVIGCRTEKEAENTNSKLQKKFGSNFHVKHLYIFKRDVLCKKNNGLKLVKGTKNSKLLNKAIPISEKNLYPSDNKERYDVSKEMQKTFGDFGGNICIQRNALRFIKEEKFIERTLKWIKKLE